MDDYPTPDEVRSYKGDFVDFDKLEYEYLANAVLITDNKSVFRFLTAGI